MTKKTVKKVVAKAAAKPAPKAVAPVADSVCNCGCACGCRGGFWRFVKKLIIFAIIFALGFAACKFCCCGHHGMKKHMRFAFVEGCLDVSKIKCPEMLQKVMAANANGDDCITKEELAVWKKAKFANKAGEKVSEVDEVEEIRD
ncbi:MAG: hypothetical protein LBK26_01250 [Rickettsiales bacterium]|jgi:hypothetical protein|nr:hypothetical protein [Rickettsiales bacterium]